MLGCSHSKNLADCFLCRYVLLNQGETDPFLKNALALQAECDAVANYVMDNGSVMRDALTWLAARRDWTRTLEVNTYFKSTYPELSEAMERVNKLPAQDLDGRAMATWNESRFDQDTFTRPHYCSWCYLPRTLLDEAASDSPNNTNNGKAKKVPVKIFYVATAVPAEETIIDYLMVVLNSPPKLIEAITDHASAALKSSATVATNRLSRRLSFYKTVKSPRSGTALAEGSAEGDPREARAERMEHAHALRKTFEAQFPRLILIAKSTALTRLEPRPDYILKRHRHYVNVFTISLPDNAPLVWKAPDSEKW
jgi:hypothetical protein